MKNLNQERERILLGLLTSVERDATQSQRHWASELSVALGLVNTYLKHCVKKGYVKVKRVPARRYAYYLTPKGLTEKSRLTATLLSNSLEMFRTACADCTRLYDQSEARGWNRLALCGTGELAEIAVLNTGGRKVRLVGVVDSVRSAKTFRGLPVVDDIEALPAFDAVIVTDQRTPQAAYDRLIEKLMPERVMALEVLGITPASSQRAG